MGKAISVSGRAAPIRAYVYLGHRDPPAGTLESLGRFLSGTGTPGPGVVVGGRAIPQLPLKASDRSTARSTRLRGLAIAGWTLVGTGLATAVAGGGAAGHSRPGHGTW